MLNKMPEIRKSSIPTISDSIDNNFWFIHITDLHLSKYSDNGRSEDLLVFCKNHMRAIKPSFVLVSGDIADSKTKSALNSRQHKEEWERYRNILVESEVIKITKWFDIRGNHDSFNVPHVNHSENLFKKYSMQGNYSHQSYKYTHQTSFGRYSFIGVDACPDPGLKRPYNFFGILYPKIVRQIEELSKQTVNDNMTIWFAHYPTSTVISPHVDFRSIIGQNSIAYMCGHLHTLLNTVPQMYTLQTEGFLELELADWRDTRTFRVAVIDHDIFSFIDMKMSQFPVIVISNPKNSKFILPSKEASYKIALSTHIRIFVWSFKNNFVVNVSIDNQFVGIAKRVSPNHPLHVLEWNPYLYTNISHQIRVDIEQEDGIKKHVTQSFNVDGRPDWDFKKWPSIILMGDINFMLKMFYYLLWNSMMFFILTFRYLSQRKVNLFSYQDNLWIIAVLRFVANNQLFYPIVFYLLYSVTCPLLITELVDDHWGWVYLNGVYINGIYLPEASPFLSELCQNSTFILPFLFILIRNIRYDDIYIRSVLSYLSHQRFYLILLVWQCCIIVYWTLIPYGILTTLLSPCRFHVITLSLYLILSVRHTRKLAAHLYNNTDLIHSSSSIQSVPREDINNLNTFSKFHHTDASYNNLAQLAVEEDD